MKEFIDNLSKVLKYKTDKEDFEKAIDQNPLDSTNHLVYADWLDENGEPEEAMFRRSLGNWLQDRGKDTKEKVSENGYNGYGVGGLLGYPEGTEPSGGIDPYEHFEHEKRNSEVYNGLVPILDLENPPNYQPNGYWAAKIKPLALYHLRWDTYRGMEEALRRAFMNKRKKEAK